MTGFGSSDKPFLAADLLEYPEAGASIGAMPGVPHMRTPACTGPIGYTGQAAVAQHVDPISRSRGRNRDKLGDLSECVLELRSVW